MPIHSQEFITFLTIRFPLWLQKGGLKTPVLSFVPLSLRLVILINKGFIELYLESFQQLKFYLFNLSWSIHPWFPGLLTP